MSASSNIPTSPMVESVRPGEILSLGILAAMAYALLFEDWEVATHAVKAVRLLVGRSQSDDSGNPTEAKS